MARISYPNLMEIDFGAIKVLGDALKRNGISRPLICTDRGIVETGIFDTVRGVLPNDVSPSVFQDTPANPTEGAVRQAVEIFKETATHGKSLGRDAGAEGQLGDCKFTAVGVAQNK